ncbi:SCO1664 family protein [Streptomyces sp. B1866]|uniref:SCO1664 family protein n=1 Tax=Streptomyces sp. B1866 TaxID=3075431 RepID=UPI00288F9F80|nr:SCO1664 family protein [Streptomyces sp. B1866]MDT3399795.1 SCO1664 family protein [Streptomyces sp. B1866]
MSAPERIPPRSGLTPPARAAAAGRLPAASASAEPAGDGPSGPPDGPSEGPPTGPPPAAELLARGELTVRGQVREASNAVLFCTVAGDGNSLPCVYKPVAGERPLWDFPDGTLAQREVAAYELSEATGWGLIPPTVLRDGPYGPGMCQLWIEAADGEDDDRAPRLLALVDGDEPGPGWKAVGHAEVGDGRTALLVHADDPRLRRLAVLDAVINNGDRKGGHLLPTADGGLYAIDHGVTFNAEDKLRTLLWGWAGEPLPAEAREVLGRLAAELAGGGPLAARLAGLITGAELDALRARVAALLRTGRHPEPGGRWPAIPWPPI